MYGDEKMIPADFDISQSLNFDFAVKLMGEVLVEPPFRAWPSTLNSVVAGAFSYVSPSAILHYVKLGRYCSIGNDVSILSEHPTQLITTSPVLYQNLFHPAFRPTVQHHFRHLQQTIIGNDVWIGAGVLIKTGVEIGDGAIIGAGSVVTRNVPSYSIVAGSPAKLIRRRFDDQTIERLLKLAWWRYDVTKLNLTCDVDQSIDLIEQSRDNNEMIEFRPGFYRVWRDKESQQIVARKCDNDAS